MRLEFPYDAQAQLNRRKLLLSGLSGATLMAAPSVLRAQTLRKVRLTLPWVAQGSTLYPHVSQQAGFWSKRGLDVDIARGYGSFPALQALAAGQFDFAVTQIPPLIISIAEGLALTAVTINTYTVAWAIAVRGDSPIKSRKDLAGRTIAGTATATDYIILGEYLKRAGVDPATVKTVQLDNKIIDQSLIRGDVEAISSVIPSAAPIYVSQNVPVRFLPYRDVGLDAYGHALATRSDLIEKEPDLVAQVTDGLLEGIEFTLTQPEEALKLFVKAVPETELSSTGITFAKVGLGTYYVMADSALARNEGLGYGDPTSIKDQIDIIIKNLAKPNARTPSVAEVYNPKFIGEHKLSAEQWDGVAKAAAPYASFYQAAS